MIFNFCEKHQLRLLISNNLIIFKQHYHFQIQQVFLHLFPTNFEEKMCITYSA